MSLAQRRRMVDREHLLLSIARQCALLGVARSSLYYRPREASGENPALMQAMDRQYLDTVDSHSSATPDSIWSRLECSSRGICAEYCCRPV